MKKAEFNAIIKEGRDRRKSFLAVKIETEGNPAPEIIINPAENLDAKQNYYNKAYDGDMTLISAKNNGTIIKITDALMTSNLNDLSWFVY